jgi:hypothetical protein
MLQAAVVPTPRSALAYAVVIRRGGDLVRQEPAHSLEDADRLIARLLSQAEADFPDGDAGEI